MVKYTKMQYRNEGSKGQILIKNLKVFGKTAFKNEVEKMFKWFADEKETKEHVATFGITMNILNYLVYHLRCLKCSINIASINDYVRKNYNLEAKPRQNSKNKELIKKAFVNSNVEFTINKTPSLQFEFNEKEYTINFDMKEKKTSFLLDHVRKAIAEFGNKN